MACSKWSWRVWLPLVVCRPTARQWIEESNQMRQIKASWDCADFEVWGQREVLERRRPVRRSSVRRNCRQLQRQRSGVSRACALQEKRERCRGQDVIAQMRGILAESYVWKPGSAFFATRVTKVHATLLAGFQDLFILDTLLQLTSTPSAQSRETTVYLFPIAFGATNQPHPARPG
jgi:hypothetical protein